MPCGLAGSSDFLVLPWGTLPQSAWGEAFYSCSENIVWIKMVELLKSHHMEISSSTTFFLGMNGGWEHKWSRTDKCLISIAYFTSFLFNIISVMSTRFFFIFINTSRKWSEKTHTQVNINMYVLTYE